METAEIVLSSEDSLQIQFEQKICSEVNLLVSRFVETFEQFTKDIPEILEVVPTYCSVSIYFDAGNCSASLIKEIAESVLEKLRISVNYTSSSTKILPIPVCYEDPEFAPDLETVASHGKLTKEQVIEIHSSTDYLIYMMGFLPGFPYLGGLDERLETPRLETPRTKIPAGSVAIGGKQTGLYPVESPGGWQIIGRTPLKVFDLERNPVFLYEAGDKLRFIPISRQEFDSFDEKKWLKEQLHITASKNGGKLQTYECSAGLKILQPGIASSIQDGGTRGYQKFGIGQSGVMDYESYTLANQLCGNSENAACIETLFSGPDLRFAGDCDFAVTGGVFNNLKLNNTPVPMNTKLHAKAGDILSCGFVQKGLRSYIAFAGGILVPKVFGSSSTNLKGKIGGYGGRLLASGDELAIGRKVRTKGTEQNVFCHAELDSASHKYKVKTKGTEINELEIKNEELKIGFQTKGTEQIGNSAANAPLFLDCVPSSQFSFFSQEAVQTFLASEYEVSQESDRMGIRFKGQSLNCGKTDIISDSIPFGAVQITSAGLPVVMAADRQTTGGYAKIACVTKKSMCKLAQAVPGTKVRFQFVKQ